MDAIYKHAIETRQYKDHISEHRGGSRQRSVEGKEPMDRPQVTLVQNIWLPRLGKSACSNILGQRITPFFENQN